MWNPPQRHLQEPLTGCMPARLAHSWLHSSHMMCVPAVSVTPAPPALQQAQGGVCVPCIAVPHTPLPRESVQEAHGCSVARQLHLATQAPTHLCVMRKTRVGGSVWKARIALPRAAARQGGPARGEAGQRACCGSQGNLALQSAHPQASPLGSCGTRSYCCCQCGPTLLPGLAHPSMRARATAPTRAAAANQVPALQPDVGQHLLDGTQAVWVLTKDDDLVRGWER